MRRILLLLLVLIAALLVVNTFVVNGETKDAQADVGEIVELPEGDLQVRDRGPKGAPAIVLLHCYTCSIRWWEKLEPLLLAGGNRRVVSIDLPGHGGSEKAKDGYKPQEQADLIAAALREVGVQQALLVGQSLGGAIATTVAERHGDLVRGVVVMDTPPRGEYRDLPAVQKLATAPVIGQASWQVMTDGMIRDGQADAFADGDVPDQFVDDLRDMTYTSFKDIPSEMSDYIDEIPLDDRLAELDLPLLVIFGSEDTVVKPPDEAADEFRDIPGSRVVMLKGVGHTPQWEAPAKSALLIRAFDSETIPRDSETTSRRTPRSSGR
jgi:pimeloyl-ACP methyl ester carboxylesterase